MTIDHTRRAAPAIVTSTPITDCLFLSEASHLASHCCLFEPVRFLKGFFFPLERFCGTKTLTQTEDNPQDY